MAQYASGFVAQGSTAAAINIQLGWIPDVVEVRTMNGTVADSFIWKADLREILEFDGGGGTGKEIVAGDIIKASDNGWEAVVQEVLLQGGTWAGGDAAGRLILEAGSLTNRANVDDDDQIDVAIQKSQATDGANTYGTDYATVDNGLDSSRSISMDHDTIAAVTGIAAYNGTDAANSRGFTIPAIGGNNGVLQWQAWGHGGGNV